MEKLVLMQKQLLFLHEQLRKVKSFHKTSSKNFRVFHTSMKNSIKGLNKGDLFNDIHCSNILSLNVIEFFTTQILKQSFSHSVIHRRLKEEGNKLKIFEKELEKRIKVFSATFKKREHEGAKSFILNEIAVSDLNRNEPQIVDLNKEVESTLKEMSFQFGVIRENIKRSFDDYIDSLCAFSQTKKQMRCLQDKTEENFKDCSPILEKKFDLLLNSEGLGFQLNNINLESKSKKNDCQAEEEPEPKKTINMRNLNLQSIPQNFSKKYSNNEKFSLPMKELNNQYQNRENQNPKLETNQVKEVEHLNEVISNHHEFADKENFKTNSLYSNYERNPTHASSHSQTNSQNYNENHSFYTPLKAKMLFPSSHSKSEFPDERSAIKQQNENCVYNEKIKSSRSRMVDYYINNRHGRGSISNHDHCSAYPQQEEY